MHTESFDKKSTFWKRARLHFFALVCAKVRSLCATFCADQNPQKHSNFELNMKMPKQTLWVNGFGDFET